MLLYPAIYNRKGFLGDFEIYVLDGDRARSLSGRRGPYTSIKEWFSFAGRQILLREPEYVLAALLVGQQGNLSRASGKKLALYKVSREEAQDLGTLAGQLKPLPDRDIILDTF